jgi:hypothetical protein
MEQTSLVGTTLSCATLPGCWISALSSSALGGCSIEATEVVIKRCVCQGLCMWPTKKLCASSNGGLAREDGSAGSLRQLGYEGFGIDVLAQRTNVRRRYDAAMLGGERTPKGQGRSGRLGALVGSEKQLVRKTDKLSSLVRKSFASGGTRSLREDCRQSFYLFRLGLSLVANLLRFPFVLLRFRSLMKSHGGEVP